jgi:hypothetical protein
MRNVIFGPINFEILKDCILSESNDFVIMHKIAWDEFPTFQELMNKILEIQITLMENAKAIDGIENENFNLYAKFFSWEFVNLSKDEIFKNFGENGFIQKYFVNSKIFC